MLRNKAQDVIKLVNEYVDSSETLLGERFDAMSKQGYEIRDLTEKVTRLESDKAQFERRNKALRETNEKLQARVQTLETEVERLKEANKQLEQQMSKAKQSTRVSTRNDLEAQMEEDGIADENEGLAARSPDKYDSESDSSDCVLLVNDVKVKEEAGQCMDVKTEAKPPASDALALMSTGASRCKAAAAAAGAGLETDSDSETDAGATGADNSTVNRFLTQQDIDMVCERMQAVPTWGSLIERKSVNVVKAVQYYKTNLADLSPCKPILDSVDALVRELATPIRGKVSILRDDSYEEDDDKDSHKTGSARITSITSCFRRIIEKVGNSEIFKLAISVTGKTAEQLSSSDPSEKTMKAAKELVHTYFICKKTFRDNAVKDFREINSLLSKLSEDTKKRPRDEPSDASRDTKKRPRDEASDAEGGNGAAASH